MSCLRNLKDHTGFSANNKLHGLHTEQQGMYKDAIRVACERLGWVAFMRMFSF